MKPLRPLKGPCSSMVTSHHCEMFRRDAAGQFRSPRSLSSYDKVTWCRPLGVVTSESRGIRRTMMMPNLPSRHCAVESEVIAPLKIVCRRSSSSSKAPPGWRGLGGLVRFVYGGGGVIVVAVIDGGGIVANVHGDGRVRGFVLCIVI